MMRRGGAIFWAILVICKKWKIAQESKKFAHVGIKHLPNAK